jgi:hypothetical protein
MANDQSLRYFIHSLRSQSKAAASKILKSFLGEVRSWPGLPGLPELLKSLLQLF